MLAALSLIGFAATPGRLRPRSSRRAIPYSLSAGTLLVGLTTWSVGSLIGTTAVFPLLALIFLGSLSRLRPWASASRDVVRLLLRLARTDAVSSMALLFLLALLLPQLLLPVVDSDGLRYHLALPKLFLLTGKIFIYRWDPVGTFPQITESIYLIVLRIAGGETAKFVHAGFFVASLAVLILLLHRERRSRRFAVLAAVLFAAAPVVLAPATAAFTDHAALFHLATALVLLTRSPRGETATFACAGIALAAAAGSKLTAGPVIAALILYGLWMIWSRHPSEPGWKIRTAAWLVLPPILAFAPFGLEAALLRGDPFYPLGYAVLHKPIPGIARERLEYTTQFHSNVGGPLGIGWTPGNGLQDDEVAGLHHAIGLFALALCIRDRRARRYLLLIVPLLAVAVVMRPPTRYLIPMFFGLAALEAQAAAAVFRRAARFFGLLLALPAIVASASFLLTHLAPADFLRGRTSRRSFLETRLPGYRATEIVNSLPPGGVVMALDLPVPYYFDRPWIVEGILFDPPLVSWVHEGAGTSEISEHLRELGVRYLVVTPGYGGGTPSSLSPIARTRAEASVVAELRRSLRLVTTADRTDIFEVVP